MYNYKAELKLYLDGNTQYRECLFKRGYLITDAEIAGLGEYPFYGQWSAAKAGRYTCFVHNDQQIHIRRNEKRTAVLIGHAYNPFDMQYDENLLLDNCLQALETSENSFFDKISEFTGIHLICIFDNNSGNILAVQDCSGMQSCYFGVIQGKAYITEYPQLLGDILNLKINPFVEKLVTSKCYNIGNRHLPGNLSPYKELKRLGGNTCLRYDGNSFSVNRFFPTGPHAEFQEDEYSDGIARIYNIIHNGIVLCTKKWDRRAISLSGGTDSKTTLACAAGLYDQFSYFSFYSKPQEMVDAQAAQKICRQLKVGGHTIYPIPEQNEEIPEYDFWRKLIAHNTNYIKNLSDNEIRKYVYLYNLDAYDIELKSWISETARVFFGKKISDKNAGSANRTAFQHISDSVFHASVSAKENRQDL